MSEIQPYPKVSIIILHLKNIHCLIDSILSLNKISYENFDIFIVHNGPKSKILEENLASISQRITEVINTGENVGFAMGNNIGIKQALRKGGEYILLLNDDTVVSADFLDILLDAGENKPDAGMLGSKIYYFDEPRRIWFAGAYVDSGTCMITTPGSDQIDEEESFEPIESDYITGCALLIKRQTIEQIGLLDERFFLYWEDVDWGLRAQKAGYKNLVIPGAHIWHKVSTSTGGMDSVLRVYHKTRSHLLMARIHVPKMLIPLHIKFFRDIAWLLFKSHDTNRSKKARAYIAAIRDYHLGKTDKGPQWIWNDETNKG
ncbi:glycosyltransferase family 2 protein [candidate division WS5 bacterium]|uniref:Glycosyltransferase family 2 protein n=1 Tax=candidate division WS5 bacterium TaxID=2093353 RepID=A0A419DAH0_9BACT|nr:MAG: glycosyltransferase family 2 protein [candidate division WS5 bacterium]